jgi:hypothetical protein
MTFKVKAMALLMGLDTYAQHGGFYEQHCALMQEPTNYNVLYTLKQHTSRNPNSTSREDERLRWVYEYFLETHVYENDAGRYYDLMVNAIKDWQDTRFPSVASRMLKHEERHSIYQSRMVSPDWRMGELATVLRGRDWHRREQDRGAIHPAVIKACYHAWPTDLAQLVLEWPRASKEGQHKIAYTRDEKYGDADRQLVISVSKYLTRHFPALSSDRIRDISARYCEATFQIVNTMPKMLNAIINGPGSCMAKEADYFDRLDDRHPYEAYDPKYGWSMALVTEGTTITGRALLNDKKWVRTYRWRDDGAGQRTSHSDVDERLISWLTEQGYQRANGWRGFRLARLEASNDCGFVAPYIDGGHQDVNDLGDHLAIVADGEYRCNNVNGDADERAGNNCEDCDDRISDDDTYRVYRAEDRCVCASCRDNNYTYVYGRNGHQYYVDNDDVVEVDGEYYHDNYLDDNNIVRTHDGEYYHADNVVYIESNNEYYPLESDLICCTADGDYHMREDCVELENGEWCLFEDAWCCDHTGDYYARADHDIVVTKCGKMVHEDHADQYELEGEDDADEQPAVTPVVWTLQPQ